jgi:hypothetical protein
MNTTITWIRSQSAKACRPKWLMTAGITDDGVVFVPAWIAGKETAVTLAAGFHGNVATAIYRGDAFLPVEWMAGEYPKIADDLRAIEKKVRDAKRVEGKGA